MEQISDTSTALVTDGAKSSDSSVTVSSFTTPSSTDSNKGNKKARDGSHGLKFETKLLTLFCVRGLSAGYKFELGKENEDLGDKFDDLFSVIKSQMRHQQGNTGVITTFRPNTRRTKIIEKSQLMIYSTPRAMARLVSRNIFFRIAR
jgi:hypothetical protein